MVVSPKGLVLLIAWGSSSGDVRRHVWWNSNEHCDLPRDNMICDVRSAGCSWRENHIKVGLASRPPLKNTACGGLRTDQSQIDVV